VIAIGVGGATMATDRFIPLFPHLLKIQDPFLVLGPPLLPGSPNRQDCAALRS
jgi:hypothetical protein